MKIHIKGTVDFVPTLTLEFRRNSGAQEKQRFQTKIGLSNLHRKYHPSESIDTPGWSKSDSSNKDVR